MSLERPTRSIHLYQTNTERLKIVSGTNVDLHMRQTKLGDVYLASFGRQFVTAFWSDSVDWFDVSQD